MIPAFNEERVILSTLETVHSYLRKKAYTFEILPVDDGSSDRTSELALDFAEKHVECRPIRNPSNRGKGYTVRRGIEEARGTYVLFTDADLSTPIHEVDRFLQILENGCDVVLGSRDLPASDVRIHQPWYREMMGKVFNRIVRMVILSGFVDTQCGFKVFRMESVRNVLKLQKIDGYSFDVEMLFLTRKLGFSIREEPVIWENCPDTRVSAIHDSTRMFVDLLRIRYYDMSGRYG